MNFFKSLFGGGGRSAEPTDVNGIYVYVRPRGCDEVVRVRINRMNDLSESDEGGSYYVHKVARGVKCRQNVELDLYFDGKRNLTEKQCTGGEFVDANAFLEWQASHPAGAS